MGMKAPMTAYRGPNAPLQSSAGRQMTGAPPGTSRLMTGSLAGPSDARPMTSVSGAGYKGSKPGGSGNFDPMNLGKGPAPPLAEKSDNSPEDKAKDMEQKVHRLIEEVSHFTSLTFM